MKKMYKAPNVKAIEVKTPAIMAGSTQAKSVTIQNYQKGSTDSWF